MDKFLTITESQNFGLDAESDLVLDEQTFQSYMHKVPIWNFLKLDRLQYLAMSKEEKLAAIKKYVHAMKNLGTSLTSTFITSCCNLLLFFVYLFAFASSYSVVTSVKLFNHG